jgi:salicylate hydroxylase
MTAPHLLIIGAGIAGLTAAIALGRRGVRVTLIERRIAFEEVGAGLQLSPNASRILIDLGLSGGLTRDVVAPERLDIRVWSRPRAFASMPMNDGTERYGAPFWVTRRADLQTTLLDAARQLPNVRLLVGRTLETMTESKDGITATILSETGQPEIIEAQALIGADGLWSQVRGLMGNTRPPAFTGYEAWRALIPSERAPSFIRQPEVALWMGPDCHAVHYPVAGSRLINLVVIRKAKAAREGWNSTGDAGEINAFAGSAAQPLRDLIQSAPGWQVWSLNDSKVATMAKGHLALMGDAAHPVLPFMAQGAALAIEDAAVLARLVSAAFEAGKPLTEALRQYDAARRKRAAKVHATARANADFYHMAWPFSLARDLVLRRSKPERMLARYDWLYGWQDSQGRHDS